MMLMRNDPFFATFDQLAQQVLGHRRTPAVMPNGCPGVKGIQLSSEFDLPGWRGR